MALTLDDAVRRRLDLGTGGLPDPAELAIVRDVMARALGWDAARTQREEETLRAAYPPGARC